MRRLIDKIKDIWRIEELRTRIKNTALFLLVYRLGTFVILPGIDSEELAGLQQQSSDSLLGLVNIFAGGAFARGAILALGIMPYISASIFMQLVSLAIPAFARMQKEGEEGRRKINQYTRILTIAFTAVQAIGYLNNMITTPNNQSALLIFTNPDAMSQGWFMFTNVILLTAGTMFTMWLGERITDKGLGNGISLIIMVGIIARLPTAFVFELESTFNKRGPFIFLIEMAIWIAVILTVILLTQGTRKIPVNYAKRVVGNRQYGGQRNYIPLKVLGAGVMPIIFAQAIMFLPASFMGLYKSGNVPAWLLNLADTTSVTHNGIMVLLIVLFTYFYTAIIFNPMQIADDMKRNNGFIPGIKPGKKTSEFIDDVISRITLPGALFISAVAIMPAVAQGSILGVNPEFAQFFGGTSLLILVGVVLDTLQQIESFLLMRHYDGLMRSGRIKGRMGMYQQQVGN